MTFAKACIYPRSVKDLHKNLPQPHAATYFDTMSNEISSHIFIENDLISLQYVKTYDIQSLKEFCRKRGYKVTDSNKGLCARADKCSQDKCSQRQMLPRQMLTTLIKKKTNVHNIFIFKCFISFNF